VTHAPSTAAAAAVPGATYDIRTIRTEHREPDDHHEL
jgi:hypothetical protein